MPNTSPKRRLVSVGLAVAGLVLLMLAAIAARDYWVTTRSGPTAPQHAEISDDGSKVSERKTGPVSHRKGYKVPAGQPRVIAIPSLGINSYVERVSVNRSGQMAVPSNIDFTGWYTGSVPPGQDGLSIINGHSGGRYRQAILTGLSRLKEGDIIRVQMGDLSWREFSVSSIKTYSTTQASAALFDKDPAITGQLNLITCDGRYDASTKTYDQRTLVTASVI